ncbi:MAG: hypothetical protein H7A00_03185 [Hahellaceae bacterium]|nr:hypothetical protein [Hahellaceae bacterium]
MENIANLAHIDSILNEWKAVIGNDFDGYRNHVVRMVTFSLLLRPCDSKEQRAIEIAACFHDIGIWTSKTWDYLPPSVLAARNYLEENSLGEFTCDVEQMILHHHKLLPVKDNASPLVETFRRGDLVDFSCGSIRFGIPAKTVARIRRQYANHGFHKALGKLFLTWMLKNPLNPAPMVKL